MFAFSCSPIMHNAPVSALRISARRYASRRPMCTTSQITLASVPSGTGRRYVTLRFRLTPPEVKMPGFDMAIKTVDVSMSMIVAAQPPWRLPMRLQRFWVTVRRYEARGWGSRVANSKRRLLRLASMPQN